ncbi:hypothetical protein M422DRAFT_243750 [Sphaerobolus stellatus SS14]|nr:hypothetical protein M422DRAFT_243750 [Sphaerobolus stellatus SS14]
MAIWGLEQRQRSDPSLPIHAESRHLWVDFRQQQRVCGDKSVLGVEDTGGRHPAEFHSPSIVLATDWLAAPQFVSPYNVSGTLSLAKAQPANRPRIRSSDNISWVDVQLFFLFLHNTLKEDVRRQSFLSDPPSGLGLPYEVTGLSVQKKKDYGVPNIQFLERLEISIPE